MAGNDDNSVDAPTTNAVFNTTESQQTQLAIAGLMGGPAMETAATAAMVRGANKIEMQIDRIRDIAKQVLSGPHADATHAHSGFRRQSMPSGALGPTGAAEGFVTQHNSAKDVFEDTISGLINDLQTVADNLVNAAATAQGSDDAAEARFKSVMSKMSWSSESGYNQSRIKHAQDLTVSERAKQLGEQQQHQQDVPVPAKDAGPKPADGGNL